eukprot:GFYU01003757.1.p1 GENE.GFYU01003757.1~~GFYU01003757.1.p1  ORF type:complete len:311 (-),score=34.91 GFYU01003757.1:464-1396(-)
MNPNSAPNQNASMGSGKKWDSDELLRAYIYDYLTKNGFTRTAACFQTETSIPMNSIAIDAPGGFLTEWWSVFWDMFTARSAKTQSNLVQNTIPQPSAVRMPQDMTQPPQPSAGAVMRQGGMTHPGFSSGMQQPMSLNTMMSQAMPSQPAVSMAGSMAGPMPGGGGGDIVGGMSGPGGPPMRGNSVPSNADTSRLLTILNGKSDLDQMGPRSGGPSAQSGPMFGGSSGAGRSAEWIAMASAQGGPGGPNRMGDGPGMPMSMGLELDGRNVSTTQGSMHTPEARTGLTISPTPSDKDGNKVDVDPSSFLDAF